MDPLTCVGLASNIAQFIHFSSALINGALEIYDSAAGMTEESRSLTAVITELNRLSADIESQSQNPGTADEEGLRILAAECKTLSRDLLGLLRIIKPKDVTSKKQSLWAALKGEYHKSDRQRLEKQIERCRSQLELQINVMNSAQRLTQIQAQLSGLADGTKISSLSNHAQDQFRELLEIPQQAQDDLLKKRILNMLHFRTMYDRYDIVERAHLKTFEWMFLDQKSTNFQSLDPALQAAAQLFGGWLSSGNGIFHMSGKLGSGKSTLMKFLTDHPSTRTELQKWAGKRNLVVASFFFWKPGDALQKSLVGLQRSLLHDTLKSRPELITKVFPAPWNQIHHQPWQAQDNLEIRPDEVRKAFDRLLECQMRSTGTCFCFFIDGLDEYEEAQHTDYRAMVQSLLSWTATAPRDVKICVSSREYNVFLDTLDSNKRLRLQDLTRRDMELYVLDRLELSSKPARWTRLSNQIVDKSSGIFLWVSLVVTEIRNCLEDDCPFAEIEELLNSLPEDLENLFFCLLQSLSTKNRRKAFQTFAIILELQEAAKRLPAITGLSLVTYSFLDNYNTNVEFAMQPEFSEIVSQESDVQRRSEYGRKRLIGTCKGLAEARKNREYSRIKLTSINDIAVFTHRSIQEFLQKPTIVQDMDDSLKGFLVNDATCQLLLAEVRFYGDQVVKNYLGTIIAYILYKQGHVDMPPYDLRARLSLMAAPFDGGSITRVRENTDIATPYRTRQFWMDNFNYQPIICPLLISAHLGHHEYVTWRLDQDPMIPENTLAQGLLVRMAGMYHKKGYSIDARLRTLQYLILRGVHFQSKIHACRATGVEILSSPLPVYDPFFDPSLSFWQAFIVQIVFLPEVLCNKSKELGNTITEFLLHDADVLLKVAWKWHPDDKGFSKKKRLSVILTSGDGKQVYLRNLVENFDCLPLRSPGITSISILELVESLCLSEPDRIRILHLLENSKQLALSDSVSLLRAWFPGFSVQLVVGIMLGILVTNIVSYSRGYTNGTI